MSEQLLKFTPEQYQSWVPDRTHLAHYVRFYHNIIPDEICDGFIQEFDNHPELQVEQKQGAGGFCFQQLSISANCKEEPWKTAQTILTEATSQALGQYAEDTYYDDSVIFPAGLGLEEFRINKTLNNGSKGFLNHVDVGDYSSARRFITVVYYLNDIEEGGEAAFPTLGFAFKPTRGSVVVFPSTWTYLHAGYPPISSPKYILTTFCHYV